MAALCATGANKSSGRLGSNYNSVMNTQPVIARSGATESSIAESMRREFQVLSVEDRLPAMLEKLQNSNRLVLPVVDHGEVVGLFTADNLAEFVMVQSALKRYPTPPRNVAKSPRVTVVTSDVPDRQSQ